MLGYMGGHASLGVAKANLYYRLTPFTRSFLIPGTGFMSVIIRVEKWVQNQQRLAVIKSSS